MSMRSDNVLAFAARNGDSGQRSTMFVRSCLLLLVWGLLVTSCAAR